jgi:hypothetical protein
MTLDDLIRDAAKRGELTHLSVVAVAGGFSATFTPASTFGTVHERDADPVIAMTKAIKAVKLARPSSAPHYTPTKTEAANVRGEPGPLGDEDDMDFG